jgi:hypothetical protein
MTNSPELPIDVPKTNQKEIKMPTSFQTFNPGDFIEDTHVEQFIIPIQNLENGQPWYGEDTGAANAFEVDLDPAPTAYVAGMLVHFRAANTNSGAATLDINGLGTKELTKEDGASLIAGDVLADQMVSAIYNGVEFQMISPAMNPSVTAAAPTENLLVYSEVTPEQLTSTPTDLALPSFNFDSGKSYLLELDVATTNAAAAVMVTLDDGTTSYDYPSSSTVGSRSGYEAGTYHRLLPNLSGVHTITVNASYLGFAAVRLYEVNDNLVYADFTPAQTSGTVTASSLANFTAVSGHDYLLVVRTTSYSSTAPGVGCYIDDGTITEGLPQSDPTTDIVTGPSATGGFEVSTIISGLSGSSTVTVRGKVHSGVSVRIYDIT